MFIGAVDTGLERLVRTRLPLPEEVGDIAFEAPTTNWSAQLSRITVSMFLYEVRRSTMPSRSATMRPDAEGLMKRRRPQPMIELCYLLSAWAGSPRDEHQLLGDLASLFAAVDVVPAELFAVPPSTSVTLALGDERNHGREVWAGIGGAMKGSFPLMATVGADAFDWEDQAPPVERIVAMANRMSEPPPAVRGLR